MKKIVKITQFFRRTNLFLMIFSMLFIVLGSTYHHRWIFSFTLLTAHLPVLIMGWIIADVSHHLIVRQNVSMSVWLRRSLFLLVWSVITIGYGLGRLLYNVENLGSHKVFYSLVLVHSLTFYLNQINQDKLKRYVSMLLQRPAHITVLSYMVLIVFFAVLLLLPISQYNYEEQGLTALNALFLTVSAFCVTGLSPVDISMTFSPVGLTILLIAVQFGGIGIALLGSIMLYVRRSVGLSGRTLLAYSFSDDAVADVGRVALRVLLITVLIEMVGAFYLTYYFVQHQHFSFLMALGYGMFFSISAFCNAGFSLFANGNLDPVRFDLSFLWVINVLITLGVLGFNFIFYEANRLKRFFYRLKRDKKARRKPVEQNSAINGTLVLWSGYGSLIVIVVVFFLFYAFEHPHSLYYLTTVEQYVESFFLAVDAKTAGFMSRDYETLRLSSQSLFLVFMLIGGASGGTAGGIKLNTILVIFAGLRAFIQQQPLAKIGKFSISSEDVRKANILLISAVLVIVMATFLLSISERNQDALPLFWEVVSALGTVGTSLNYTSDLTIFGKIIIMLVMVVGRMGALTLLGVVQEREIKKEPTYPLGNIYIG